MFLDTQIEHCLARLTFDTRIGRIMKEETHTPMEPSFVLTATSGNVRVTTKLYGSLEYGRLDRERAVVQHRADQLNLARPAAAVRQREYEQF